MTDYAKPTSPGKAVREVADELEWFAKEHYRQSSEHRLIGDALMERARSAGLNADKWDRHQPKEPDA